MAPDSLPSADPSIFKSDRAHPKQSTPPTSTTTSTTTATSTSPSTSPSTSISTSSRDSPTHTCKAPTPISSVDKESVDKESVDKEVFVLSLSHLADVIPLFRCLYKLDRSVSIVPDPSSMLNPEGDYLPIEMDSQETENHFLQILRELRRKRSFDEASFEEVCRTYKQEKIEWSDFQQWCERELRPIYVRVMSREARLDTFDDAARFWMSKAAEVELCNTREPYKPSPRSKRFTPGYFKNLNIMGTLDAAGADPLEHLGDIIDIFHCRRHQVIGNGLKYCYRLAPMTVDEYESKEQGDWFAPIYDFSPTISSDHQFLPRVFFFLELNRCSQDASADDRFVGVQVGQLEFRPLHGDGNSTDQSVDHDGFTAEQNAPIYSVYYDSDDEVEPDDGLGKWKKTPVAFVLRYDDELSSNGFQPQGIYIINGCAGNDTSSEIAEVLGELGLHNRPWRRLADNAVDLDDNNKFKGEQVLDEGATDGGANKEQNMSSYRTYRPIMSTTSIYPLRDD
ncbi:hypothetical protein K505DRAFT_412976 [Melanomma pulvis-pyrius CBS 109.77]|uniref:Uncharacterized protein n=1 Tax=Melanomma pulvis-pyrius CBS 109.77 TaxID=1314802 RepID=A0A6A6XVF3_9PLEO|nr:hypothetical protein K505DRAFT_412976 [Melanomma pulvis-pyrius CBS 109.77]